MNTNQLHKKQQRNTPTRRPPLTDEDAMDSSDEHGSDSQSDVEYDYVSSCSSSWADEAEDDTEWQPSLGGDSVHTRVVQLTSMNCCAKRCLSGSEDRVEKFVHSLNQMNKDCQRTSLLTAVAISASIVATKQQVGRDERQCYVYFLPFCGEVCKNAFQMCYQISNDTLNRVHGQVRDGSAYVLPHKNTKNTHARSVDDTTIANWLRRFAERVGDAVTVRFRHQNKEDGTIVRYVTKQQVLFLPAYFTWARLLQEYENYFAMMNPGTTLKSPSLRSFQRIAQRRCQDIVIRAPSSNVCDICVLY